MASWKDGSILIDIKNSKLAGETLLIVAKVSLKMKKKSFLKNTIRFKVNIKAVEEKKEPEETVDLTPEKEPEIVELKDLDLGLDTSKVDIANLKKLKAELPEPLEMIEKGVKMNKEGAFVITSKKKMRKMDFNKLKDKQINVKSEMIRKIEEKTSKLRANRQLQGVVEMTEDSKRKYVDSECDLSPDSIMETCEYDWRMIQSEDGTQMNMVFDFKDTAKVSLGDTSDHVIVKFWGAPLILTEDLKPIFKEPFVLRIRIPTQADAGSVSVIATKAVAATVNSVGKTIIWI